MLSSFLLSFREGLEAALIIGIILIQLMKMNQKQLSKSVYMGAISGLFISVAVGFIAFYTVENLEESSEVLLEGVMRVLAAALIAYFILWLHKNSNVSRQIQSQVSNNASGIGLFILSFLSVFREGMELIIFNLTQVSQNSANVAFYSLLGIVLAVLVAYVIFKTSVKLNLQVIFKALGIVLIYLGGEMFAEGLKTLIPGAGEPVEIAALLVFLIPSLIIFLKNDVQKWFSRKEKNQSF
ncbi:MAG: FTR1 family protein [Bacillales bacterium]|nr:FTR1 family protein [Bacillales bacterium]